MTMQNEYCGQLSPSGYRLGMNDDQWASERLTTIDRPASEYFHVERQIFLGIFPDRLHQLSRLHQHLVAVVVERRILEQHSRRALAFFQPRGQGREIIYRLLEPGGEFLVARHLTQRALAGID